MLDSTACHHSTGLCVVALCLSSVSLAASCCEVPPSYPRYVMGPGLPGTLGNFWTNSSAWPATTPLRLFLQDRGLLSAQPPAAETARSFVYDPLSPVPTLGGNNLL